MCCVNCLLFLAITLLKVSGSWGLRNVSLLLLPSVVQRGQDLQMMCLFDLQDAPLYSLKFYRGTHEFYRHIPSDNPPFKIFPFKGLQVDLTHSSHNVLVLRDVGFSLAGNVSCEVSSDDAPHFSTAVAAGLLSVVELPKVPPQIETDAARQYEVGDQLKATCSSAPARPAPQLVWFINDEPAHTTSTRWNQSGLLQTRSVTLDTRLLRRHLASSQLMLKCTAVVADVYKETTTIALGAYVPGEPKHERVRFSSASQLTSIITHLLITILLLHTFVR